jgi:hypothetical protein
VNIIKGESIHGWVKGKLWAESVGGGLGVTLLIGENFKREMSEICRTQTVKETVSALK